jgi:hypothetical protein
LAKSAGRIPLKIARFEAGDVVKHPFSPREPA